MQGYDQPVYHVKLSQLNQLVNTGRRLMRITGCLDINKSTNDTVVIYSQENDIFKSSFLEKYFEFDEDAVLFSNNYFEVWVNLDLMSERQFNIRDLNPNHDLLQFIGYKDSTIKNKCVFKAMHIRIIKRMNLNSYYYVIDTQNDYITKKEFKF